MFWFFFKKDFWSKIVLKYKIWIGLIRKMESLVAYLYPTFNITFILIFQLFQLEHKRNEISLSEWLPWQHRLQKTRVVGHSSRSKLLTDVKFMWYLTFLIFSLISKLIHRFWMFATTWSAMKLKTWVWKIHQFAKMSTMMGLNCRKKLNQSLKKKHPQVSSSLR